MTGTRVALLAVALVLSGSAPASAQDDPDPDGHSLIPGIEQWAQAVAGSGPRWEGQTVPWPDPVPRPRAAGMLRSTFSPLAVHAGPDVPAARMVAALDALEASYDLLRAAGWRTPAFDAGRSGTSGLDLFLVRDAAHPADAGTDVDVPWWHLDASTAFAVVDADVPDEALDACVADAYAQALLFSHDPAEAEEWRRATAAYLAWLITGRWGCEEGPVRQQREPWRGPIAGAAADGAGGALFLAMISARADGDRGRFLRDLWGLAAQKSWHGAALHGTPDLWEALDRSTRVAGDPLKGIIEEISVARFFSGTPERQRAATFPQVRMLPDDAVVPLAIDARWAHLPRHLPPVEQEIEPHGSGYAWIDVRGAPAGEQLRVWLRGEYGVEWALVAVQLGAGGEELGRIAAPPRREPRSFVPVDLAPETVAVLVVVTNLSSRLPDADVTDMNARSFRLILDRAGAADRGEPE